jgi:hypothetical protein
MAIGASQVGPDVRVVGKIIQLGAVTTLAQGFIGQPELLRVGQVTTDALHVGLAVRTSLPLLMSFGVTLLARGRVNAQLHDPVSGWSLT